MPNLVSVPTLPEHLLLLKMRDEERAAFSTRPELFIETLRRTGTRTVLCGTEVVCVLTWQEVAPGVCEVALIPSEAMDRHRVAAARHIRGALVYFTSQYRRVQAATDDARKYKRFMRFLGFSLEGVFHKYHPDGSNLLAWGKVWR